MRRPLFVANWKMNHTPQQTREYCTRFFQECLPEGVEVVLCPPFTSLFVVQEALRKRDATRKQQEEDAGQAFAKDEETGSDSKSEEVRPDSASAKQLEMEKQQEAGPVGAGVKVTYALGAQNLHWELSGAYTGEVSPLFLAELDVSDVIVGHSERRQYFGETDEQVGRKAATALAHRLNAILCVGENWEERQAGRAEEVVLHQLQAVFSALRALPERPAGELVIAYEPVWAIGSGLTPTVEEVGQMMKQVRQAVATTIGDEKAQEVRLLYGGSVKPENIADFMAVADIDGALVGGASLDPLVFAALIRAGTGK